MDFVSVHRSSRTTRVAITRFGLASTNTMPRCAGKPGKFFCSESIRLMPIPRFTGLSCPVTPLHDQPGQIMPTDATTTIDQIIASPAFQTAKATIAAEHDRMIEDLITLTEIESPSFKEDAKAQVWMAMAKAHGLEDVGIDAEGNVTAIRRGGGNGALVCVAAHLDTVFPAGTNVKVRREGNRLFAPGIGDDPRSRSVLRAWGRALDAAGIRTRADILFVADVGEEGP